MPELGDTGVKFTRIAREWRCKYAYGPSGGPGDSACLKACQALLDEHLEVLKELPNVEIHRVVCGGCQDFKVVLNQPCADHDAWKAQDFIPEKSFIEKLKAIDGVSEVAVQEYTKETL